MVKNPQGDFRKHPAPPELFFFFYIFDIIINKKNNNRLKSKKTNLKNLLKSLLNFIRDLGSINNNYINEEVKDIS